MCWRVGTHWKFNLQFCQFYFRVITVKRVISVRVMTDVGPGCCNAWGRPGGWCWSLLAGCQPAATNFLTRRRELGDSPAPWLPPPYIKPVKNTSMISPPGLSFCSPQLFLFIIINLLPLSREILKGRKEWRMQWNVDYRIETKNSHWIQEKVNIKII